MPSELTKADVALFVLVGGYCVKCKASPQPMYTWGVYCAQCWNGGKGISGPDYNPTKRQEWNDLLELWRLPLAKWEKIK